MSHTMTLSRYKNGSESSRIGIPADVQRDLETSIDNTLKVTLSGIKHGNISSVTFEREIHGDHKITIPAQSVRSLNLEPGEYDVEYDIVTDNEPEQTTLGSHSDSDSDTDSKSDIEVNSETDTESNNSPGLGELFE